MTVGTRYVPCFSWSQACNADWAAISALGGWAAAVVTVAAVLVAFYVGTWPVVHAAKQRARIGRVEARVAAVDLGIQALHIGAGLQLLDRNLCYQHVFNVAVAQFRVLSPSSCERVVPFLDCLPRSLEQDIANTIANMSIGVRGLERVPEPRGGAVDVQGIRTVYEDVFNTIESCRRALADAAGGGFQAESLEEALPVLVAQLRKQAAANLLARLQNETQTR